MKIRITYNVSESEYYKIKDLSKRNDQLSLSIADHELNLITDDYTNGRYEEIHLYPSISKIEVQPVDFYEVYSK